MLDSERELPCSSKGHQKRQREKLLSMEVLISQGKALLAKKKERKGIWSLVQILSRGTGVTRAYILPQNFKSEMKLEIVPKGVIV